MDTTERNGEQARWSETRQTAPETHSTWLAGLMFCYNMPDPDAADDCAEDGAPSAAQSEAEALMRYYNS